MHDGWSDAQWCRSEGETTIDDGAGKGGIGAVDKLPPKRLLDDLNTADFPEPVWIDRTDCLSCLFTEP